MYDESNDKNTPTGRSGQSRRTFSQSNPSNDNPGTSVSPSSMPSNYSGFQCVAPSAEKRQEVMRAQTRANETYEQHRMSSRLGYISEIGCVGGSASEMDARYKAQQQLHNAKKERQRKQEQYKAEKRRQEEEEGEKIKAEGRRKAELNEKHKMEEDARRQQSKQEEHRRTNEAFLDRLEGRNGNKHASSEVNQATAPNTTGLSGVQAERPRDHVGDLLLLQLIEQFPYHDVDILNEMLQQANYDISQVKRNLLY